MRHLLLLLALLLSTGVHAAKGTTTGIVGAWSIAGGAQAALLYSDRADKRVKV